MSGWGQTDGRIADGPASDWIPLVLLPLSMCLTELRSSLHCCCLVVVASGGGCKAELASRLHGRFRGFDPKFRMRGSACLSARWAWPLYTRGKAGVQELISSLEPFFCRVIIVLLVLVRNILVECTVVRGARSANTTLIRSFKLG